ncbi:Glucosaminyl phosphatidylinositol (GlcN-PI) nositol acylation protein [Curvularia kusanoi]|uniref:GPI-anchored wall transfer protein 1 n=1 Tax=Curvularia kusanoi TaxID=90978 RepID=A0A9P4TD84_CURKU|nr:Glucosaminyl phosphatidylinositol (GlcN-PI) nositol acylation protein [Curvularia kusanoi]
MAPKTYKEMKEAWVTGHTGSSVADVNIVSFAMPLSILLWSVIQQRLRLFIPYTPAACFVDFLLNCAATLCATTVYSSSPWALNLLLLLPAIALLVLEQPVAAKRDVSRPKKDKAVESKLDVLPVKPFITHYRGSMMIITCVAILAVDFPVFPRRFAKVENWGTSLMDMGVGSFVFTAGVVSARSVLKEASGKRAPLSKRLVTALRHAIPLLVLGVIRFISVKGLDYAEHVTEYGVHWNFFFTLGFLPPFAALLQNAFDLVPSYAVLSVVLAGAYELVLDKTSLGAYILVAPRTDLLSKNREGIFSFVGYLAIFLAGQSLGCSALPRESPLAKDASMSTRWRQTTLGKLALTSAMWTALFLLSGNHGLGLTVSRRLANLPYVLWVASFNSYHITLVCLIEKLLFPNIYKAASKEEEVQRTRDATSTVLHAFNRNGLAVFLVANLLTGLVNMTMPTLHMSVLQSMAVLAAYMGSVAGVALALDRLNDASDTLRKPFKSPFRTPLKPKTGAEDLPSELREVGTPARSVSYKVLASTPIAATQIVQAQSEAVAEQVAATPVLAQPRFVKPVPSLPHAAVSSRSSSKKPPSKPSLTRELMQLRSEIQILTQAQALASSSKDEDLQVLIDKWRAASRAAAEELFGTTRDRVNRMGGVGAWKEREKEAQERAMKWELEEREAERDRLEEAKENGELEDEAYDRYHEMEDERGQDEEQDNKVPKAADDDSFTMDMMLKTLNIDLDLIGYNKEAQRWDG